MITPTKFDQQTGTLGRPPSMTEEECASLPVFRDEAQYLSCWRVSWRDRLKILFGAPLWLWVFSGGGHPPVAIETENPFEERK